MIFVSRSNKQTKEFAEKLAKKILNTRPPTLNAKVVALVGDLGAGKTTFTQGFAKGLGIKHRMVSPTFLIFRKYQLVRNARYARNDRVENASIKRSDRSSIFEHFYHVDVYRINKPSELNVLGFKKIISDPKNIVLIEWADKIKKILPKDTLLINFQHGSKENERIITMSLRGAKRRGNLTL